MDSWPEWREKLLKVAQVEAQSRRKVKMLLSKLDDKDGIELADGMFITCIYIIVTSVQIIYTCIRVSACMQVVHIYSVHAYM